MNTLRELEIEHRATGEFELADMTREAADASDKHERLAETLAMGRVLRYIHEMREEGRL